MLEVTIAMRYDMLKDEKSKEQKNRQASILESEPLSQTWNVQPPDVQMQLVVWCLQLNVSRFRAP